MHYEICKKRTIIQLRIFVTILKLHEIIENIPRYVICYENDLFSSKHEIFYRVVFKTNKMLMIISVHVCIDPPI